jgi:DNA-binding HxlR family transcriptional regulator
MQVTFWMSMPLTAVRPHDDSVYRTLRTIGDGWSWLVMRDVLLKGTRRFDELQRGTGAARATLTARLRQLVDGGVLERTGGRGYAPTLAGEDFLGCVLAAWRWGSTWYPDNLRKGAVHTTCATALNPVLRCTACREVITPRDVTWSTLRPIDTPTIASRQRAPRRELLERGGPSPTARTLAVIGDWWSSLVIREAFYGARRFDAFERSLGLAPNILSSRLAHLVEETVLERVPYQAAPVRHEYRLTDKGLDLYHVPLAMLTWGDRWLTPLSPPVQLSHERCGHPLRPVLSCHACAQELTLQSLNMTAASA